MEPATSSAEIVRTTTYLKDANIIGYLAVFGAINIPIWLIKVGMIVEKIRANRRGGK